MRKIVEQGLAKRVGSKISLFHYNWATGQYKKFCSGELCRDQVSFYIEYEGKRYYLSSGDRISISSERRVNSYRVFLK